MEITYKYPCPRNGIAIGSRIANILTADVRAATTPRPRAHMIPQTERRTHRRFPLTLPTELKGLTTNLGVVDSETLDVSAGGVLLRVKNPVAVGENIQFLLKFGPDLTMTSPALLVRFWGTVVRSERRPISTGFDHAAAVNIQRYEFVSSESPAFERVAVST